MKGHEVISHLIREEMPDREQVREICHRQPEYGHKPDGRPARRTVAVVAAVAAVVCLSVFGAMHFNLFRSPGTPEDTDASQTASVVPGAAPESTGPAFDPGPVQTGGGTLPAEQSGNSFTLLAFSMEPQTDGSIELREMDILSWELRLPGATAAGRDFGILHNTSTRFIRYDFENDVYQSSIGLTCRGENIRRVELFIDGGFFGKARVSDLTRSFASDEWFVTSFTHVDVENLGSFIILDSEDINDDLLLCWGVEGINDPDSLRTEVTVRAVATFYDGTSAGQTISFILAEVIEYMREHPQRVREQAEAREFYSSIPLEECELVEDSVMQVIDHYVYYFPDTRLSVTGIFHTGGLEGYAFDDNGVMLIHWGESYDHDERDFIVVYKKDADGIVTGMIYRTPLQAP